MRLAEDTDCMVLSQDGCQCLDDYWQAKVELINYLAKEEGSIDFSIKAKFYKMQLF